MKTCFVIPVVSQAVGNQLASLVQTHGVRSIDRVWNPEVYAYTYAHKSFKVGSTAIFWLVPSHLHYAQYSSEATELTLNHCVESDYSTANELAQALSTLT